MKHIGHRQILGISLTSGTILVGINLTAIAHPPQTLTEVNLTQAPLSSLSNDPLQTGIQFLQLGQFQEAIQHFQEAIALYEASRDVRLINALGNLGIASSALGLHTEAIEYYNQARQLEIILMDSGELTADDHQQITWQDNLDILHRSSPQTDSSSIGNERIIDGSLGTRGPEFIFTPDDTGHLYFSVGQYEEAISYYQSYLSDSSLSHTPDRLIPTFNNMGLALTYSGRYEQAFEQYESALELARRESDLMAEANILGNMGITHYFLGDYLQAIALHQQSLTLDQRLGNRRGEAHSFNNLGTAHTALGQYQLAIGFHLQSLSIFQSIEDVVGQSNASSNLGIAYAGLENNDEAITVYQEAIALQQETGNRQGQANALNNLGLTYSRTGRLTEALDAYQNALVILQDIGDRRGTGITLGNLGRLLEDLDQPQLAILFYKQSVNTREQIRQDIRTLPQSSQQAYTDTVAETYRRLADLLLQNDRILEAQRVLDLLKVQELDDYLQDVRGTERTTIGSELLADEERLQALYDQAIAYGKELRYLTSLPQLNAEQSQRLQELTTFEGRILDSFYEFIELPEVRETVDRLSLSSQRQNLDLESLNSLQNNLQSLNQNAVLLYPLILDDRLELILVTPHAPPIRRTSNVNRRTLNETILAFRQALEDPTSNALPPAQQLYDWLIQPFEAALSEAEAETIIYAPDSQLRYIPLAALHDGSQWLSERYRINHITAASLTDFTEPPQPSLQVLAAAFTEGRYEIEAGDRQFEFDGLQFAGIEVEHLVQTVPNTLPLLNDQFTIAALLPQMNRHTVVHLATHAAFVPGKPEDSFILFGSGETVNLRDIRRWNLPNVDLVVLSACETGLGTPSRDVATVDELSNGEEILGFGYQLQSTGARATIASLWQVSDGGTQALMDAFYAALQQPGITKAEALRRAQVALVTGNFEVLGVDERGATGIRQRIQNTVPETVTRQLSHPYYWAPFILIGNGL